MGKKHGPPNPDLILLKVLTPKLLERIEASKVAPARKMEAVSNALMQEDAKQVLAGGLIGASHLLRVYNV